MRGAHRPAWYGIVFIACVGAAAAWFPIVVSAASPLKANGSATVPSCHPYLAVAGDTLIDLARHHLAKPSDWRALARVNHVRDPRRIPVGTRLCLPVDLLKPTPAPGVVLDVTGEVMQEPPSVGPAPLSRPARSSKGIRRPGPGAAAPGPAPAPPSASAPPTAPIKAGDAIPPGTRLRTGANGYVTVRLPDGSILKVQADTDARLEQSQQYESTGIFSTIWRLLRGRVESQVEPVKDGRPRHQIKTPQATIGVRGTAYRVATDGTRTLGETLSGTVAVQGVQPKARGETLLRAGEGTVALPGRPPAPPMPLPAAPDLSSLPALHERLVLRFELPAMAGAQAYRIQVAEDEHFQRVRGETTSATPLLRLTDLPDGDYFLRARVADAQGLEGSDAFGTFRLNARPEPPIPLGPAHKGKVRGHAATLNWAAHSEAVHYRLQIARDASFMVIVAEHPVLTETRFTVELPPGDYHWRIAATAASGAPSAVPDHGPWGDAQLLLMRPPPPQPPPPQLAETTLSFQLQGEQGQRFEFQLARDKAFTQLIQEIQSADSLIVARRPEDGGTVHVRYRAIDADGFIGPFTTPQTVTLPPCVRSGDGSCVTAGDAGGPRFLTTQP